ncbi:hypothetical protein [Amycolatopsis sp. CA-126428]|uniref:hypothetical protein n=1 Tax=Amycolatopsis sp. CA-126428 TaxID=2073158 RepID=UPI001E4425DE|nr:hypothetical protein [Amycolatopsis sp. CA-126428]
MFSTFTGFQLAQFAFALPGVLAVTSEYGTGTMRLTFAATPRRGRVLAAKLLIVGGIAFAAEELLAFLTFFTGQAALAGKPSTSASATRTCCGLCWAKGSTSAPSHCWAPQSA